MTDTLLALGEGTRFRCFSRCRPPPVKKPPEKPVKKKGAGRRRQKRLSDDLLKAKLFDLRKRGFNRLYQNGQIFEFSTPESLLELNFSEPVFLLVDRISVSAESAGAHRRCDREWLSRGRRSYVRNRPRKEPRRLRFSQRFECKHCHIRYDEPEPHLFSFNNPFGACPRCQGFGNTIDFDLDR